MQLSEKATGLKDELEDYHDWTNLDEVIQQLPSEIRPSDNIGDPGLHFVSSVLKAIDGLLELRIHQVNNLEEQAEGKPFLQQLEILGGIGQPGMNDLLLEIRAMEAYRAHFALDDVHWVWYSVFFTVVLCLLFERRQIPHRFDWLLLLPLTSGLLDWYENQLQHVFLNSNDFSGVVDPLPLFSTLASVIKWTLALIYSVLTITLLARGSSRRTDKAAS